MAADVHRVGARVLDAVALLDFVLGESALDADPRGLFVAKTLFPDDRLGREDCDADGAFKDVSAYANPITRDGVTANGSGVAGSGAVFAGSPLKVAGGAVKAAAGSGLSWSAWIKPSAAQKAQLFSWRASNWSAAWSRYAAFSTSRSTCGVSHAIHS